jgi:hypothetical protein
VCTPCAVRRSVIDELYLKRRVYPLGARISWGLATLSGQSPLESSRWWKTAFGTKTTVGPSLSTRPGTDGLPAPRKFRARARAHGVGIDTRNLASLQQGSPSRTLADGVYRVEVAHALLHPLGVGIHAQLSVWMPNPEGVLDGRSKLGIPLCDEHEQRPGARRRPWRRSEEVSLSRNWSLGGEACPAAECFRSRSWCNVRCVQYIARAELPRAPTLCLFAFAGSALNQLMLRFTHSYAPIYALLCSDLRRPL